MDKHFLHSKIGNAKRLHYEFLAHSNSNLSVDLADYIALDRLSSLPKIYAAWQTKRISGIVNTLLVEQVLESMFRDCVGTSKKQIPVNQLEGTIAAYLWHSIISKHFSSSIIYLEPPSFSSLDGGSDGFEIHNEYGTEGFRLWESKKESSGKKIPSTVKKACIQIQSRSNSYLARIVFSSQLETNLTIKSIKASALEKWLVNSSDIGVGISITTIPPKCNFKLFKHAESIFTSMNRPEQIKTIALIVPNFNTFCLGVRDEIWKGI